MKLRPKFLEIFENFKFIIFFELLLKSKKISSKGNNKIEKTFFLIIFPFFPKKDENTQKKSFMLLESFLKNCNKYFFIENKFGRIFKIRYDTDCICITFSLIFFFSIRHIFVLLFGKKRFIKMKFCLCVLLFLCKLKEILLKCLV